MDDKVRTSAAPRLDAAAPLLVPVEHQPVSGTSLSSVDSDTSIYADSVRVIPTMTRAHLTTAATWTTPQWRRAR